MTAKTIKDMSNVTKSREFRSWSYMKTRCLNPNCDKFYLYGGRGITIHPEWIISFQKFLDHIGPAPSHEHSLDRINTNGNYEPGNVKWSTHVEQCNNRRTSNLIMIGGETKSIKDWCRHYDLKYHAIWNRIVKRGMSPEQAFSLPRYAKG